METTRRGFFGVLAGVVAGGLTAKAGPLAPANFIGYVDADPFPANTVVTHTEYGMSFEWSESELWGAPVLKPSRRSRRKSRRKKKH